MTTYIEEIATRVKNVWAPQCALTEGDRTIYLIFAILALTKGTDTTKEDVHHALDAWNVLIDPEFKGVVPFDEMPAYIQNSAQPFVDAIHKVSIEEKSVSLHI